MMISARPIIIAIFIFAIWMAPKGAGAKNPLFWNGVTLLDACENPDVSDICTFYIMGVHDQNSILQAWKAPNPLGSYCLPDTGDSRQLVATVYRFLRENPAQLHYGAPTLVVMALVQAFPCH